MQEYTSGNFSVIGAMVSQNSTTGVMTISKVFKGAPAYEAGMLPGDILYEVGDTSVVGMDMQLVISDHIRGEDGSFVKIKVLRGENNDEVELNVERRKVEVPTVEHQMLEDQVGYIYVLQFDMITPSQFCSAVDDLENQGMKKLIIDLRGNPGGAVDSVVEMLAYILPEDKMEGLLLYTGDKDGKGEKYFCKNGQLQQSSDHGIAVPGYPKADGHEVKLPLVVLVNGHSASASEVFTGAIQDYDWGTVVGTQTFGKGIVQNLIPLGDGTAIKLTTSHYYTPSGFDLHKVGLTPDVVVELKEELKTKAVVSLEEDNQVQEALKILAEP
ncbi:MAG: S41 family peptidase [Hungatella sp.]